MHSRYEHIHYYYCTLIMSRTMIGSKMCLLIPIVRTPCINEGEINVIDLQYEGYLNIFTGGQVNITGRVGVCRDEFYDTVCDANWDANDAAVLCRSILPRKKLNVYLFFFGCMVQDNLPWRSSGNYIYLCYVSSQPGHVLMRYCS